MTHAGLPKTIEEMKACLGQLLTEASIAQAELYQARPEDVFIATYPKSGTTWMQQMVHVLRGGGAMDFGEITEVVPWLESCHDLGVDPDGAQVAAPRAFKTHLSYQRVPKGARYIYIVRNPKDVLLSFYRFFEGFMFEPGTIDLETFCYAFFSGGSKSGRYWEHLRSWWPRRSAADTLFLAYEDMKRNPARTVRRVAAFLGIVHDEALLEKAAFLSSFAYMSEHKRHFDDHYLLDARRAACNLPAEVTTSKVRGATAKDRLSPALHAHLDELWAREIEPLGFADYPALCAEVAGLANGGVS